MNYAEWALFTVPASIQWKRFIIFIFLPNSLIAMITYGYTTCLITYSSGIWITYTGLRYTALCSTCSLGDRGFIYQLAFACCQLFAKLFGQFRRKIRPLRKKFGPLVIFPFWRNLALRKNIIFVCVSGKITIFVGHFPRMIGYEEGNNFLKIQPLFGPFCSKSAKIWPHNCPATPLFIRPIPTYTAEISASWQHWPEAAMPGGR